MHKYSVILNNHNKPSDRFLTSGYGDPSDVSKVYEDESHDCRTVEMLSKFIIRDSAYPAVITLSI